MARYIFKRLVTGMLSLSTLVTITFFLMYVVPGGPFSPSEQRNVPEKILEQISEKYGLNGPPPTQYIRYLGNFSYGDMGTSFEKQDITVNELIVNGFPVSVRMGTLGITVALVVGIPLGAVAAVKRGKLADSTPMALATIGASAPSFMFCMLMMYVSCGGWKIFPPYGLTSWKHYVLLVFCMAFSQVAYITRFMRSSMLETMRQNYMRTERSKGVPEWEVIGKYTPRNSVPPVVTYVSPLVAALLTGTFIIKRLFSIPELGRYFVSAITNRDYSVTPGLTVLLGMMVTGRNLIVDAMYAVIDPRVRTTEQMERIGERIELTVSDVIPEKPLAGLFGTEWEMGPIDRPSISHWRNCWIRPKRDKLVMLDIAIVITMTLVAMFTPMFSPYIYGQTDFGNTLQWPNSAHLFGIDKVGRDILVRTTCGARISPSIGLAVATISMVIGVLYGGISGYVGEAVDTAMMRVVNILTDIPSLIYMILIMTFLGNAIQSILIAMCLIYWATTARVVRAQILILREQNLALAAKVSGLNEWQILIHHLIPDSMGSTIVTVTSLIPSIIFREVLLGFLGTDIQVSKASWGTLVNDAIEYLFSHPCQMLFPALAISVTIFVLNFIGDGLWNALDPRLKR